jgi:hypothetical protein
MFQFAEVMTCQKPERSGLPSEVRGIAEVEAAWPKSAAGTQKTTAAIAACRMKQSTSLENPPGQR